MRLFKYYVSRRTQESHEPLQGIRWQLPRALCPVVLLVLHHYRILRGGRRLRHADSAKLWRIKTEELFRLVLLFGFLQNEITTFYYVLLVDCLVVPRLVLFSTHYSELLVRHPTLKHCEYYHEQILSKHLLLL